MSRSRLLGALAAALIVPSVLAASGAPPASAQDAPPPASDIRELTNTKEFTLDGEAVKTPASYQPSANRALAAAATPPVGTVRQWLGLDDFNGILYRKDYTLRGVGDHIEVWVANDLSFPAGDCRAQIPGTTEITDDQVNTLITEFDSNIYPKETQTFSTPPDRDGSNSLIGPDRNGNGGVYTGDGDKTVTLIDNVRDDNFFSFPEFPTYIAGFFSAQFNELFDRNVMTVDAFDWTHRTTADPPDEPTADLCTSRPARPFTYESTFAHEWQHLLHYYTDPFEGLLLNEGLSDFAMSLTGYANAAATVFQPGPNSHIYCFQGFGIVQTQFNPNPRECGGAENSLNLWNEGSPNALLADYGNAYSLMLYLFDHYGVDMMTRLHLDGDLQGIASIAAALEGEGVSNPYRVIHDFQSSTLLDKIVDNRRGIVIGTPKSRVTTASLNSTVNLANPASNATPGAAPNGADYVVLQDAHGNALRGRDLRSLKFQGAATLPTQPVLWSVVGNDPDRPGDPVLWSGNANSLDSAIVTPVTVPADDPTLSFLAKYGAEFGFDYGYVGVSTDGGATYTYVPGDKTVDGPLGPALNGTTTGFEPHTYDLSAYAGQSVLLEFRYVSDGGVNEGGLLLDDITLGGALISDGSSLDPFQSPTQIFPTPVANWDVKLIAIDERNSIVAQAEFNHVHNLNLGRVSLLLASLFPKVVAVISYDDPSEQSQQYAPYTLTVNGVVQPGGGGA